MLLLLDEAALGGELRCEVAWIVREREE